MSEATPPTRGDGSGDEPEVVAAGVEAAGVEGPAVAERMAPDRRAAVIGFVSAVLAVVACGVAVIDFPADAGSDQGFAVGALLAAVTLLIICGVQVQLWQRAVLAWTENESPTARALRLSFALHVISYPVVLICLYLCIEASALSGFSSVSGFALGLAALFMIIAQVTGAVQYVRTEGAPGTVPTHVRRLLARVQAQR